MHALVTGAAGFIGSTLTERLLIDGHTVTAIDCLTGNYDPAQKRSNVQALSTLHGCRIVQADLRWCALEPLLEGVDVVFHQAGQPGVRSSWESGFPSYVDHNILVTQRLLEALRARPSTRLVFASSSSVYGNAPAYPTSEDDLPRPHHRAPPWCLPCPQTGAEHSPSSGSGFGLTRPLGPMSPVAPGRRAG